MPADPDAVRAADLRRWADQFTYAVAIADARTRHEATVVGVVRKIRLVPGRSLEVEIEDGTARLTAEFSGRSDLPGLELGGALRLNGTVAADPDGRRRMRNPTYTGVTEPYH